MHWNPIPDYEPLVERLVIALDPTPGAGAGYLTAVCAAIAEQLDNELLFTALVEAAESHAEEQIAAARDRAHALIVERFGMVTSRG